MADDELEGLRAEAEAAGVKVDGRWGADRLREEIDQRRSELEAWQAAERGEHHPQAADDDEGDDPEVEPDSEPEPEPESGPEPLRAGGHINRHDGKGWMPDPDAAVNQTSGPPKPVDPGKAGLPGNPAMTPAGWPKEK